jgi:hypothetical protein
MVVLMSERPSSFWTVRSSQEFFEQVGGEGMADADSGGWARIRP